MMNAATTPFPNILSAREYSLSRSFIGSGLKDLDDFLEGGLPQGAITEWGSQLGHATREILSCFVKVATHSSERPWVLWIVGDHEHQLYTPGLRARGVDLRYLRIAYSSRPLHDLGPILLDGFFSFIIYDSIYLKSDDIAFIERLCRKYHQSIVILHNYLLSNDRGNIHARLRLNSWRQDTTSCVAVRTLRGLRPRTLRLDLTEDHLCI